MDSINQNVEHVRNRVILFCTLKFSKMTPAKPFSSAPRKNKYF